MAEMQRVNLFPYLSNWRIPKQHLCRNTGVGSRNHQAQPVLWGVGTVLCTHWGLMHTELITMLWSLSSDLLSPKTGSSSMFLRVPAGLSKHLLYLNRNSTFQNRQGMDTSGHNAWDFPHCYFPDIHLQSHSSKSTILLAIFLLLTLSSQHSHHILARHSVRAVAVEKTKPSLLQPALATQLLQSTPIPLTLKKILLICTSWIVVTDVTKQSLLLLIFLQITILSSVSVTSRWQQSVTRKMEIIKTNKVKT